MKNFYLFLLGVLFVSAAVFAQTQTTDTEKILVKATKDEMKSLGIPSHDIAVPGWQEITSADSATLEKLKSSGVYIEPDYRAQLYYVSGNGASPADASSYTWWITANNNLWHGNFEDAWKITEGDRSVKIGILDSGSPLNHGRWTHPGLDSSRFIVGPSFVSPVGGQTTVDSDFVNTDYLGHCTHIIGIVGAIPKDSVRGIDQNCRIEIYKAFDMFGFGFYSWIADAIYRAVHDSCRILNMSFGGLFYSRLLEESILYAKNANVLCVVAAGNFGDEVQSFPAFFSKFTTTQQGGLDNVISVGSIDPNGNISLFSNRGYFVDVYAPGGSGVRRDWDIYSTWPTYYVLFDFPDTVGYTTGYGYMCGTSMAAPMVTGTASLMLAVNPKLTASQIKSIILSTADSIMTTAGVVKILNPGVAVRAAKDYNSTIAAVSGTPNPPKSFSLSQNYPNPFNPTTTIEFQIPERSFVKLSVFNALGQEVAVLVDEEKSPGKYTVTFDGSKLSSGIYFYRLEAGNFVETKKMIFVK